MSAVPVSTSAARRPKRWSRAPGQPTSRSGERITASSRARYKWTWRPCGDVSGRSSETLPCSGSEHHVLTTPNLELIRGDARFVAEKTLEISLQAGGTRLLAADLVVIDTGQRPAVLPVPGLAELQPLDSTSVMELASVPDHLVVLGGGYVGIEFGQMFRRFGSAVTMIEMAPRMLGKEDEDIAAAVTDILREDGIEILTGSQVTSAERDASGLPMLNLQTPEGARTLTASHILAAAGRTPNTDGLNLAATGVRTSERGFVPVNERLETNVPGVYAVGDVNGGPAFTHISYDDYRILKTNLLEGGDRTTVDRLLAYTVFMDPELGRIGLSEQEARRQGRSIRIASMPMSHVARALEVDESRGLMKVVIDAATDQVLGASILGIEGGELMSMLADRDDRRRHHRAAQGRRLRPPHARGVAHNNLFS